MSRITVLNTLGGTLLHYTEALEATLREGGALVRVATVFEPSASGRGRVRWILDHARALVVEARRLKASGGGTLLVTWPVLGYIDFIGLRFVALASGIRVGVVIHDPQPLVRAIGYSSPWRRLAHLLFRDSGMVVHSSTAMEVIESQGLRSMAVLVPLPIAVRDVAPASPDGGTAVVRVLGQYKTDRDIGILEEIAPRLTGLQLEIWGRRWPDVAGWDVHEGYVDEETLDSLVRGAGAVLIPYKRFYQSDIAIRALEACTPFVGPTESSLADLYGAESPLLVDRPSVLDDWTDSIRVALSLRDEELVRYRAAAFAASREAWTEWLR